MSDSPAAIVTGGAQGIGAAICKELLKNGYRVCIADIQELKSEKLAEEQQLVYGKENVTAVRCDVSKESDIANLFEQTHEKFKRIDLLVNNAGVLLEENPRKCLEVNLLGTLVGCHTALKYMGKSNGGNGGVVINTASVSGFVAPPSVPAYVASKHGIIGLTRSFGHPFQYDKDGVIFAALCPSVVDTDMLRVGANTLDMRNFPGTFDISSPEYVAKGVLKILEDKINGSALVVLTDGYHYQELGEEIKKLIPGK